MLLKKFFNDGTKKGSDGTKKGSLMMLLKRLLHDENKKATQ